MARRFHFGLEPVLEQRRRIEEERLRAVAAIERERVGLEDRLRAIQSRIAESRADLRERFAAGSPSGGMLAVRHDAGNALRLTLEAQQTALGLAGVLRRMDRARAELLEATTARKGVECLRERRLEEWRADERRRETAALDELATMHASRSAMADAFDGRLTP